jgi:hypothetical protein
MVEGHTSHQTLAAGNKGKPRVPILEIPVQRLMEVVSDAMDRGDHAPVDEGQVF